VNKIYEQKQAVLARPGAGNKGQG